VAISDGGRSAQKKAPNRFSDQAPKAHLARSAGREAGALGSRFGQTGGLPINLRGPYHLIVSLDVVFKFERMPGLLPGLHPVPLLLTFELSTVSRSSGVNVEM
jgi:hypothetical protein